jgi:hypothetical protein
VLIGDSVSKGLLIADYQHVFAAVSELELRGKGVRAEVLNFGVNGYNTGQEVEVLRDTGLGFDPDLILLQYSLNDTHNDDEGLARAIVAKARGAQQIELFSEGSWLLGSALYHFLRYRIGHLSDEHWWQAPAALEAIGKERVGEGFAELRRIAGHRCLVVGLFPWFDQGLEPHPYHEHHARRVAALAAENGFLLLDPGAPLCGAIPGELHPGPALDVPLSGRPRALMGR